mgnify:CR=1 FL=1
MSPKMTKNSLIRLTRTSMSKPVTSTERAVMATRITAARGARERGLDTSRSAAQGNRYAQFFLEHQNYLRPPSVMLAATHLLYHMSRIFEDHALPQSSAGLHVDRKLRRRIQEKKIAMGHKPDDHEEEQNQGGMIMGGM